MIWSIFRIAICFANSNTRDHLIMKWHQSNDLSGHFSYHYLASTGFHLSTIVLYQKLCYFFVTGC